MRHGHSSPGITNCIVRFIQLFRERWTSRSVQMFNKAFLVHFADRLGVVVSVQPGYGTPASVRILPPFG